MAPIEKWQISKNSLKISKNIISINEKYRQMDE